MDRSKIAKIIIDYLKNFGMSVILKITYNCKEERSNIII